MNDDTFVPDIFVPEGYVTSPVAIQRLAQARQTSIQSAQAEIRAKLYGRSITAYAMERSTGRMLDIISDSWATEWGVRWLESGVCKLPNEDGEVKITHERFDMFYEPEFAAIFIRETDLQRLIDANPPAHLAPDAVVLAQETPAAKRGEAEGAASLSKKIPTVSQVDLTKWYTGTYLPAHTAGRRPSRERDEAAARNHFKGFHVPRGWVRELRNNHAPEAWKKSGRNPRG
jgi:hypothetical protein